MRISDWSSDVCSSDLIDEHWTTLPFERRYKAVHVAKKLPCNWKIAQEAFMESYHVIATHPTLLYEMGDANSQYDAFGVLSRAISAQGIASPHIEAELAGEPFDDTTPFTVYRHPITGDLYERLDRKRVVSGKCVSVRVDSGGRR